MKKINILLASLIVLIFSGISFAQTTISKEIFRVELSFDYGFNTTTVSVNHSGIDRVSVNMRTLVAAGNLALEGDGSLSDIYIEYYTDYNSTVQKATATYRSLGGQNYSFATMPVIIPAATPENEDKIYYRIVAEANDGSIGYYPSSTTYKTAALYTTEKQIINPAGATHIHQSGDQTRGDSAITFSNNALLTSAEFSIEELYSDSYSHRSKIHQYTNEGINPVITYDFNPVNFSVTDQSKMPVISLYYGDLPKNINDISVKWLNESAKWVDVPFVNNTNDRTAIVNLVQTNTKLGFYAIFDRVEYSDNDYRPIHTVFSPGQTIEFRHLNDGDSVTIINMRSQTVKKITSAPFTWDGKDSSGNYVETNVYIYQIKVNGKVISGMISFAR